MPTWRTCMRNCGALVYETAGLPPAIKYSGHAPVHVGTVSQSTCACCGFSQHWDKRSHCNPAHRILQWWSCGMVRSSSAFSERKGPDYTCNQTCNPFRLKKDDGYHLVWSSALLLREIRGWRVQAWISPPLCMSGLSICALNKNTKCSPPETRTG